MIDFLGVTSPKAGSTSLHNYLIQHPALFLPEKKEMQFFNFNWGKGMAWYKEQFKNAQENQKLGEVTPTYLINQETVDRIYKHLGADVKFILMLRNPVERMLSEHKHNIRNRNTKLNLEQALYREDHKEYTGEDYKFFNIINNSQYYAQLCRLLKHYDSAQVFPVILEQDFKEDTVDITLNKICQFIGVECFNFNHDVYDNSGFSPRFGLIQDLVHKDSFIKRTAKKAFPDFDTRQKIREFIFNINSSKKKQKLQFSEELKNDLYLRYFKEDINQLEQLIGRDLTVWKR